MEVEGCENQENEADSVGLRSLAEVERIMKFAKLDRAEILPTVQCVGFVDHLDNDAVKLIEIDKSILQHVTAGNRVCIRGDKTDSAVLCTDEKTYEVREAETSNTLLLSPDCLLPDQLNNMDDPITHKQICALKMEYYEVREIRPKLKRLKELLEENMFSGLECENDEYHQGKKYTFDEILDRIQASKTGIQEGLAKLQACPIGDYWRLVDFDFMGKVLEQIVAVKDEQGWEMDFVQLNRTCEILEDLYPRNVVEHVLKCFADENSQDQPDSNTEENTSDGKTYRLNEERICQYYAELVLKSVKKFHLEEFEKMWQMSVPDGMSTSKSQLEGLALIDRESRPHSVVYFPSSELSEDITERFNDLFKMKEKWSLEEITPYIRDLVTEKLSIGAMLTKYTRSSMLNGIKVYNSKKPLS